MAEIETGTSFRTPAVVNGLAEVKAYIRAGGADVDALGEAALLLEGFAAVKGDGGAEDQAFRSAVAALAEAVADLKWSGFGVDAHVMLPVYRVIVRHAE